MSTVTEKRSLFDLGEELEAIQTAIVDAGGELTPESEAHLNAVLEEMADKVDAYGAKLKALQARTAFHVERATFHEQQAKSYERIEERLKANLAAVMMRLGVKKLAGVDFAATLAESKRCVIEDEAQIPAGDRYWRVRLPEVNRDAIRRDLLEGQSVPGARIEVGYHARLR